MNNLSNKFNYSNISILNNSAQETNFQLSNLNIEKIYNNRNHYLCTQCLKFPYIKFCKEY